MTRGQRGNKGQTKKASDTHYKDKVPEEDMPSERTSASNKATVASRRNRERQKIGEEETSRMTEDVQDSKNVDPKKDHHTKAVPQPTTEQLMIAQLIGGDTKADDPNQRNKIQKVMDITGMAEDAVATALFDAAWDEQKAIELLLEDGDHLTAWEETGSKKRKNKSKQSAEDGLKDDWDDLEGYEGVREKSKSRGQGRSRRGGSQSAGGGRSNFRDQASHERDDSQGVQPQSKPGPRRGDQPSRRGGVSGSSGGRGGVRSFPSRQPKPESTATDFGGFSGSIDTWNNPPASGSGGNATTSGSGVGNAAPGSGAIGKRSSRGSGGKDAFDNAGNWGDDFPQADDWDNEEYTGSLNETKVFTSRQSAAAPAPKGQPADGTAPASISANSTQQQATSQPAQVSQQSQQQLQSASSVVGHNRNFLSNGPTPLLSQPTPFSQSIDLSTLLQKPQTQSSLATLASQTPMMSYNQQATDSLRAGLGISPSPVTGITPKGQPDLNSFSSYASSSSVYAPTSNSFVGQGSAFTTIKPNQGQPNQPSTNGQAILGNSLPQRSVAPASVQPSGAKPTGPTSALAPSAVNQQRQRLPPASKIPNSAVEMPGDSVGPLNVHFGAMEIVKFAGSSDSAQMSGFDYQSNDEKFLADKTNKAPQQNAGLYQPAKDVAKVLPSGLNSIGGNKSDSYSSNQVTNNMPKSTPASGSVTTTQFTNANRNQTGVIDMKGSQPLQQPSEPMGNYMAYSYNQNKAYHQYNVQNQFPNQYNTGTYQNNSSSTGYGSQNMNYSATSTPSAGYKMSSTGGDQYHQVHGSRGGDSLSKFDSTNASTTMSGVSLHQSVVNNPAAVLGLTSTTNALSGKVSATTAGKVANVAGLPQAMIQAHQFIPPNMAQAFFGIQQPQLYATVDDYTMQRTGLHQLVGSTNNPSVPQPGGIKVPTTSFFDPNNSYGANSLPAGARNDGSANMNSIGNNSTPTTAAGPAGSTSNTDKSGFGSGGVPTSSDSTSSPIPVSGHQNPQQSQQPQQQQTAQQGPTLGFAPASNAFQQMPPGYPAAYFYGLQYGNPAANAQSVYQPTMNVPAGAGSASSQYQKPYNYGYDALTQPGNKDFSGNYSAGSGAKASGGGSTVPGAAGHQYWGSSQLTSGQLW